MKCLKSQTVFPKSSSLANFICFIDDDELIRIKGRLKNCDALEYDTKHPISLDPISRLLINFYHISNNHLGFETIISNVRKNIWITNLRNIVKNVSYYCQFSKNFRAVPQIPEMGHLRRTLHETIFKVWRGLFWANKGYSK